MNDINLYVDLINRKQHKKRFVLRAILNFIRR